MTFQQKERYLEALGAICPFCESYEIIGKEISIDAGVASQDCVCNKCHKQWTDQYTLTDVVEIT